MFGSIMFFFPSSKLYTFRMACLAQISGSSRPSVDLIGRGFPFHGGGELKG